MNFLQSALLLSRWCSEYREIGDQSLHKLKVMLLIGIDESSACTSLLIRLQRFNELEELILYKNNGNCPLLKEQLSV